MKRLLFSLFFLAALSLRAFADPPGNADSTPGAGGDDVKKQQLVDDLRSAAKDFADTSYELLQCFSGYCKKAKDTEDQGAQQSSQAGDGSQSPAQQVDHTTSKKCEDAFKDVAAKYNDFDSYDKKASFDNQSSRDMIVTKMRAFQNRINELASGKGTESESARNAKYRGDAKNCPPPDEKLMAGVNPKNASTASSKP